MSAARDGHSYRCRLCDNAARLKHRKQNEEHTKQKDREKTIKSKYGLLTIEYEALLRLQREACAICDKHVKENTGPSARDGFQRLAIDHDHVSKQVRGLLCNTCNRALGMLQDDPHILHRAWKYLKNPPAVKHLKQIRKTPTKKRATKARSTEQTNVVPDHADELAETISQNPHVGADTAVRRYRGRLPDGRSGNLRDDTP